MVVKKNKVLKFKIFGLSNRKTELPLPEGCDYVYLGVGWG